VIGFDYPKIEFQLLGFELLEPMALITDSILGLLSLYFAYKVSKITSELSFYRYWKLFFIFFGIGILLGGIGHTFYNQLGMYGKVQGWFLAPFAIYLSKVILVYIVFVIFLITSEESKLSTQPFLPIAINTIIGFIGFVGLLGVRYTQNISVKFKYFWLGIIILFPTALIFLLKVNLHPYFNKNDFSHLIFCVGITYFYLGVNGLSKGLKQKK
jgi:hypothetical protein